MIVLIMGGKGAGKSTIAGALADRINGIHINEYYMMQTVSRDILQLGDTLESARRVGELGRMLANIQEKPVIIDMELPTEADRQALGPVDISVWMDTVPNYDTPHHFDHRIEVVGDDYHDSIPTRTFRIITSFNLFDWKPEQHIMVGDFQPWTTQHLDAYQKAVDSGDKVAIAVLHSGGMSEATPKRYEDVVQEILRDIPSARVIKLPNIKSITITNQEEPLG